MKITDIEDKIAAGELTPAQVYSMMLPHTQEAELISAKAVMNFAEMMIGAFESGFVDKHTPTLAEVYRVAQHHVKDNYGFETETLDKKWGEALYKIISKQPEENFIQLTGHELKNSIDICIPDGTSDQLNEEYRFFFRDGKKYVTDLGCDESNQLS